MEAYMGLLLYHYVGADKNKGRHLPWGPFEA